MSELKVARSMGQKSTHGLDAKTTLPATRLLDHGLNGGGYPSGMRPLTEIRRERLRQLIDEVADGNQSQFANDIGRSRAQVGFWLTDPSKPHFKAMGHEIAREIERHFAKPAGWLDHDPKSQAARLDIDRLGHALTAVDKVVRDRGLALEGRLGTFRHLVAYAYELQEDDDLFPSGISDATPPAEREQYDKRISDELGGMIRSGEIEAVEKAPARRTGGTAPRKAKGSKAGGRGG